MVQGKALQGQGWQQVRHQVQYGLQRLPRACGVQRAVLSDSPLQPLFRSPITSHLPTHLIGGERERLAAGRTRAAPRRRLQRIVVCPAMSAARSSEHILSSESTHRQPPRRNPIVRACVLGNSIPHPGFVQPPCTSIASPRPTPPT